MKKSIEFKNLLFSKKEIKDLVYLAFSNYGITKTTHLVDDLKDLGFSYATKAGISISIEDLKVPPTKQDFLRSAFKEIDYSNSQYERGEINSIERLQKVIETWNNSGETLKESLIDYFRENDPLNSIFLMAFSGARGNVSQVRQLVGMRGLMSDSKGQIIDIPIINNFREGLTITDYIMSSYGARKGVVDTALRTADSGYLTRRLIDVAQDVIVREEECFSKSFVVISLKDFSYSSYEEKLLGRTIAQDMYYEDKLLIKQNQELTTPLLTKLFAVKVFDFKIRSPLTCMSIHSICRKCYGWNLAYCKLVDLGEAIGITAAQSIGEPGTQLTMRTFHTGGIFTSDSSRQVRARCPGVVSLSREVTLKPTRTSYGKNLLLTGQSTTLFVMDYHNKLDKIDISANTLIFFENGGFVKKNQLLAELPILNQQLVTSLKNIVSKFSGEIFRKYPSNILWILFCDVYDIPAKTLNNISNLTKTSSDSQALLNFKIIADESGLVKFQNSISSGCVQSYSIFQYLYLFSLFLYQHPETGNYLLLDSKKRLFYQVNKKLTNFDTKSVVFATSIEEVFIPPIDGLVYYPEKKVFTENSESLCIKHNSKILFIPQHITIVNRDASLIIVSNCNFFPQKRVEIATDIYSRISGFVEIEESDDILRNIIIKPGKFFEYTKLTKADQNHLFSLNNKIFFPGEVVFDDVKVDFPSFVQISHSGIRYGLLLRPIYQFNLPVSHFSNKTSTSSFNLGVIQKLNISFGAKFLCKNNLPLFQSSLFLKSKKFLENSRLSPEFRVITSYGKTSFYQLVLIYFNNIELCQLLSKNLVAQGFQFSFFMKNLQYVEVGTILAKIYLTINKQHDLLKIKYDKLKIKCDKDRKRLALVNTSHCKTYYSDFKDFKKVISTSIKNGDNLGSRLKLTHSGQILGVNPFVFKIHKGMPLYLTDKTWSSIESGSLILKGQVLGVISFNQVVTGDIIQGLPKIEEILEARKAKLPIVLSPTSGIIVEMKYNYRLTILGTPTKILDSNLDVWDVNFELSNAIDFKVGEYVYFGQQLSSGKVDFHGLLEFWFAYHRRKNFNYVAACLSFRKIQTLLVAKVQEVYSSQGVSIADKHIEVIIRQVTSKVQVDNPADTFLLPEESLDLKQINYINEALSLHKLGIVTYTPIILGITKASLLTESFISAASFQQTIRVLTKAAIEGKIDWLRGLKENVIIGQLIPAGTGFRKD